MVKKDNETTNFSTAETPEEIVSYLSLNERLTGSTHLYHYTKLESILSIIKSGYWIIRNPQHMNDSFEYNNWDRECWENVFFISFMSDQKENIGMWSMYAHPWKKGVKVSIERSTFVRWIRGTKELYVADPNSFKVDNNRILKINKDFSIKYSAVAYSDYEPDTLLKKEHLQVKGTGKDFLTKCTGNPKLAGYIKNNAWDYEKEIRLRVDVNKNIDCDAIAIKITDKLLDGLTIVKGPRFEGNLEEKINQELNRSIETNTSLFFDKLENIPCDNCK